MNFPLDGLNLKEFVSSSTLNGEHKANATDDNSFLYDLSSVIHHVGALGGGHYVTTVRDDSTLIRWLLQSSNDSYSPPPLSNKWWCYNDNIVSQVSDEDIRASSAYLLCYTKRDLRGRHIWDMHEEFVAAHFNRANSENRKSSNIEVQENVSDKTADNNNSSPSLNYPLKYTEEEFNAIMTRSNWNGSVNAHKLGSSATIKHLNGNLSGNSDTGQCLIS